MSGCVLCMPLCVLYMPVYALESALLVYLELTQCVFIEHLLHAGHSAGSWGVSHEQGRCRAITSPVGICANEKKVPLSDAVPWVMHGLVNK